MASFFSITISLWLIPVVFLQSTRIPTVGDERLGSCTSEDFSFLGSFAPAQPSTFGEIPGTLVYEAKRRYEPGYPLYTTERPEVQILEYAIACRSISELNNGFSSMTLLVSYTCLGTACTRSYQRANDGVRRDYIQLFSFFCAREDNTWGFQYIVASTEIGFIGDHYRYTTSTLPNPVTAEDGKCSLCASESTDAARVHHSYNQNTGCVSCPSSCNTGSQSCVTSLRVVYDFLACCPYVYPNGGHCLRSCPDPYFYVIPLSNECLQRVILKLEGDSIPDVLCDGDIVTYNCSTVFIGETGSLVWGVTFPGQQTQNLVFTESNELGVANEIMNFQATLLQIEPGGYIISTLSVIVNADSNLYGTEVSCTVNSLSPVVETIQYTSLQYPPLEPTGFRSTQQFQTSLDSTTVELEWDTYSLISGSEDNRPQHYELVVSPDPVIAHRNNILASPFNLTLKPFTTHTASLFAVNCFGRSLPATIQLDVVSPNAFVINEDTGDISVGYLPVAQVNGDVAPSIVCVSSSTSMTTLIWVKGDTGGLPNGLTETNLSPRTGQAVKLEWSRKMHFTDSGTYTCRVENIVGSGVVGIELLVRRPPSITSIFPSRPVVKTVSHKMYRVPVGYSGVVLTCTAVGWPPPTLSWLSNYKQNLQTKFSHDIDSEDSGYPTSVLQFTGGVGRVHAGEYICYVTDTNTTESVIVILEVTSDNIPKEPQADTCPIKLVTIFFQLQVLDTACLSWEQNKTEAIAETSKEVLIGGIISQCDECEIFIGDSIIISHGPLCSETSTIFRGEITTSDPIITSKAVCALTAWYRSRPLIRINDEFKFLDQDCSLVISSLLSSSSCAGQIHLTQIITYGSSIVVVLIFVIVLTLIFCILAAIRKRRLNVLSTRIQGQKRHVVMYQEEDYPEDFNPYTRDIRRSMYEDDITVVNEFNARYQAGELDGDVEYKTIAIEDIECGNYDDDSSTQHGSHRSSRKKRREKSNRSRLSDGDYTTQQDDHTTQQGEHITLRVDDYSTHRDNATSRGSVRSSRSRKKKSSNTLQVDDGATNRSRRRKRKNKGSTSQQGDNTSDYDDYTTQSGSDRSSQIGSEHSSQRSSDGSDRSSQRGSDRSSRRRRRKNDSTSQQDDNATLRSSDHSSDRSSQYGSDRSSRKRRGKKDNTSQQDDNASLRGSDRSSRGSKKVESDYTTQQDDYTTQHDDYTTQQDDNTTHTLQPGDNTSQRGSSQSGSDRSSQRGSDRSSQRGSDRSSRSNRSSQRGSDRSSRRSRGKKDNSKQDDNTSLRGSDRSSRGSKKGNMSESVRDDCTTQQDDSTTQQDDYTTQQDDYTTQQGDNTIQQDDNTLQPGNTSQRGSSQSGSDRSSQRGSDRSSQRGSDRSSRGSKKGNMSESVRDDCTTQQDDYTTQQDDYTTQQDDYTTQQDGSTTQHDDYTTQHDDYTTQQDDYTTQQDDYTTQQDDYTTQQDGYTTQQDGSTTQHDDYTTQQTTPEDDTTTQDELL